MEHIQSAKFEKIDQDFIFKNRREMTKSGSLVNQCESKKNENRYKPFIFTNWTILSDLEQKKIWIIQKFQKPNLTKNIQKNMFQKFFGPEIFRDGPQHYNLPFLKFWTNSHA